MTTVEDSVKRSLISKSKYDIVKRWLDIAVSAVALMFLFAPMLLIALAIYLDDPGPVIFPQYRVGRYGKSFLLYKFRTMYKNTPRYVASADLLHPEACITRFGRFLRRTSLDELPQLFNVLRGDMSLVGPRPVIEQERYIHQLREERGVYSVRPGLTGLAQINGRDLLLPEEKVCYDAIYLEKFGFWQDVSIILGTLPGVLSGEGIIEGSMVRGKQR